MRPNTLDHSCDRGLDGNMAFLQAIFFIISILCVFSFGFKTDIKFGGESVNLRCTGREHVEVTNVEFNMEKKLNEKDHKNIIRAWNAFLDEKDKTANAIKKLCQRRRICTETPVFDFGKQKKSIIKITITYNCITFGCPHPLFLDKHIVRCDKKKPEAECIRSVENGFETKRAQLGAISTREMGVFFDPDEYMEYEKEGSTFCKFKTGASKLQCSKQPNNEWKCNKQTGKYIAYHDRTREKNGHYRHDLDRKI